MDTTLCPECGASAEVQWRAVLESTDGPIEHVKLRCVRAHWFLLPVARLERTAAPPRPAMAPDPGARRSGLVRGDLRDDRELGVVGRRERE
jgi:hypothetical protein